MPDGFSFQPSREAVAGLGGLASGFFGGLQRGLESRRAAQLAAMKRRRTGIEPELTARGLEAAGLTPLAERVRETGERQPATVLGAAISTIRQERGIKAAAERQRRAAKLRKENIKEKDPGIQRKRALETAALLMGVPKDPIDRDAFFRNNPENARLFEALANEELSKATRGKQTFGKLFVETVERPAGWFGLGGTEKAFPEGPIFALPELDPEFEEFQRLKAKRGQ